MLVKLIYGTHYSDFQKHFEIAMYSIEEKLLTRMYLHVSSELQKAV